MDVERDATETDLDAVDADLDADDTSIDAKGAEGDAKGAEIDASDAENDAGDAKSDASDAESDATSAEIDAEWDTIPCAALSDTLSTTRIALIFRRWVDLSSECSKSRPLRKFGVRATISLRVNVGEYMKL